MMPTQDFGVYPAEGTAGDEVSSTYEGRHVTVTAAELLTSAGSGVATKGLPCVFGIVAGNNGVGVCFNSGTLTDLIAIDTEGIWDLSVVATDDNGASLVTGGDLLYINTTTGVVSKISDISTSIPFGYALGQVAAGDTAVIAVKVHFDPVHPSEVFGAVTFNDAVTISGGYIAGQRFTVSMPSFGAADVAKGFWIAPAACTVIEALEAHGTVAGQAGTLNVEKCNTGEAAAGGNAVLATGWDLTSVINTPVTLAAVATGEEDLVDGDELRLIITAGSAASLADAVVTVVLEWA